MAFPVRTVPLPTFLLPLTTFLPVLVVPVLTDLAKREDREPNENVSKYHGDQTDPLSNKKDEFFLVDREFALNGIHKSMIDSSKADRELTTI